MQGIDHLEDPRFHVDQDKRCAFLNKNNLCDIYIHLGEESLCEICTQHPRFHNEYGNIRQSGLGMACEEAARLIFESDGLRLKLVNETKEEKDDFSEDLLEIQLQIFALLRQKEYSIEQRIEHIFSFIKNAQEELNQKGRIISLKYNSSIKNQHILETMREDDYMKNWIFICQELDFMTPWIREMFYSMEDLSFYKKDRKLKDSQIEQLMSYYIYRYFMRAYEDDNMIDKIKFAILSCILITMIEQYCQAMDIPKKMIEIARIYSKEIGYCQENMDVIFEELLFD